MAAKQQGQLTSAAKAAAVIVALGAEQASHVYKCLHEDEIEQLSLEVAKLQQIPQEKMHEIMEDFYNLCVTQKVIAEGGVIYARDILEKAFGPEMAQAYIDRLSKSMQVRAFEFIRKANYKNILVMLQNEHPQTIAFVLSYAKAEQASQVISELPREIQLDVVERIAQLDSVSPKVVSLVESILEKRFSSVVSVDMTEIGGVNYVADIMNHADRNTEKFIFDELGKRNPELSDDIPQAYVCVRGYRGAGQYVHSAFPPGCGYPRPGDCSQRLQRYGQRNYPQQYVQTFSGNHSGRYPIPAQRPDAGCGGSSTENRGCYPPPRGYWRNCDCTRRRGRIHCLISIEIVWSRKRKKAS